MLVVLIMDGKAARIHASPFLYAQPTGDGLYSLQALHLEIDALDPANVLILPDDAGIEQGAEITDGVRALAMPLDSFHRATKAQAMADALGLALRVPVAQGLISDEELLRAAPALADRAWRPGIDVDVGDVYTHNESLWRCVVPHTTEDDDWKSAKTPALWREIKTVKEMEEQNERKSESHG